MFWQLANAVDQWDNLDAAGETNIGFYVWHGTTFARYHIVERYGTNSYYDTYDAVVGTKYYVLIEKNGTAFTVKIYSTAELRDAGGTPDIDTLTLTLHADHNFRYLYVVNTYNSGTTYQTDSNRENLDLQEVPVGGILAQIF